MVQEATGTEQAVQQPSHIKREAADTKQAEDATVQIRPDVPVNAAGNKQPDDIFGPAHEFD